MIKKLLKEYWPDIINTRAWKCKRCGGERTYTLLGKRYCDGWGDSYLGCRNSWAGTPVGQEFEEYVSLNESKTMDNFNLKEWVGKGEKNLLNENKINEEQINEEAFQSLNDLSKSIFGKTGDEIRKASKRLDKKAKIMLMRLVGGEMMDK